MIPFNKIDKLKMKKLLNILKSLQECCTESIVHENDVEPNNLSDNKNAKDKAMTSNNEKWVATLPIIIAEKNIDIPIESIFKLKSPALDIKNLKKDVYITSSSLLPMYENKDISASSNGKLFLEGFIRNKLDFSIAKEAHDSIINLDTESVIIYIPFKYTTLIHYKVLPVFSKEESEDYIPIYMSSDCEDFHEDYHETSNDYTNKKDTQSEEYINCNIPTINCEINEITIHETYTLLDKTPFNKDFPIEMNFHTIKEEIIIKLSLTLLQKRSVVMDSPLLQKIKKQEL